MATTTTLALSLSLGKKPDPFKSFKNPLSISRKSHPCLIIPHKSDRYNLIFTSSTSQSSSSSSSVLDPLQKGCSFSDKDSEKLQFLEDFRYFQVLGSGSVLVRVMRDDEMDMTVGLLSESFAESMRMPKGYVNLLGILVKQYMIERRNLMPNTATLVGYYKEVDDNRDGVIELAGTVEVSFNEMGANASAPTPTPPKNLPYICNMTVDKSLRRRGIGWHLLKASEELISKMSSSNEIYLHCRMIDAAPFNMYTKAGYSIIRTDNILILLTLQRRKHLMRKQLPVSISSSEMDGSDCNEDHPL